jgi:prepilin-type N-terminal cleavage/methylation domain-containing protein
MIRLPPRPAAFTLVEMITVIAIIAILAGLVLAVNGLVQSKSAKARADAEIRMLCSAVESYKTDNGGYPQDSTKTDTLDARTNTSADATLGGRYSLASQFLYAQLTGDTNYTGAITRNYAPDFWKPSRLGGPKTNGVVTSVWYIMDPYGNSYGYSTIGLLAEQNYRTALATSPGASRPQNAQGYNPTFDLWSTAGDTLGNTAKWAKNW